MRNALILVVCLLLLMPLSSLQAWAQDARAEMNAAGERLQAATTPEGRVAAMHDMADILARNPDDQAAAAAARVISDQASSEAGAAVLLDALTDLATAGKITDTQTLARIGAPLLSRINQMRDEGTLLPSSAIVLDDALGRLDRAAETLGLPNLAEAIDELTGDTGLASDARSALSRVADAARLLQAAGNLAQGDAEASRAFIDSTLSFFGAANPAISLVGPLYREVLVWNQDMYGEAAGVIDLVTDAMQTGQFDEAAYNQRRERIGELSRGPWNSATAKDLLRSLCNQVPILGAWCDDLFDFVEDLVAGDPCEALTCDCENVGGGLMRGPLIVQCRLHEQELQQICQQLGEPLGSCLPDARGPGASLN